MIDPHNPIVVATRRYIENDAQDEDFMGTDLLALLGCTYVVYDRGTSTNLIVNPDFRSEDLSVVKYCIEQLFEVVVAQSSRGGINVTGLLTGIIRYDMWRKFLSTASSAYQLAIGLLVFSDTYAHDYQVDVVTAPLVCHLLNEWIQPVVQWEELPSATDIAAHLFGNAWLSIVEVPLADGLPISISKLVALERPPFLPGMCPAQEDILSAPLPELDFTQ
jgi:hypothetical protein